MVTAVKQMAKIQSFLCQSRANDAMHRERDERNIYVENYLLYRCIDQILQHSKTKDQILQPA